MIVLNGYIFSVHCRFHNKDLLLINIYDHTFSNTDFSASSSIIYNREVEELNKESVFKCTQETLFSLKPSLGGGSDTTCNVPLEETCNSPVQAEPDFYGQFTRT